MSQDIREAEKDIETRQQQMELLESVVEYVPKVTGELKKLIAEFYGVKQDDSDEYLNFVLENSNWVIDALNVTIGLLNENGTVIDKKEANDMILRLNDALVSKVDVKIADVLEKGLVPLLDTFLAEARKVLA